MVSLVPIKSQQETSEGKKRVGLSAVRMSSFNEQHLDSLTLVYLAEVGYIHRYFPL